MKYSKLFDTLHSSTISESVKEDLVSKVLDRVVLEDIDLLEEPLNEGEDKVSTYVKVLSTLVNSTLTNEALSETINMIFANESQEVVDAVEEAFKEDVVKSILIEQLHESLFNRGDKPIGLSGIRRTIGKSAIKPVGLTSVRRASGEPAIKPVKKPEPSVSKAKEQFHTKVTPTPQPKAEAPKSTTQPKSSASTGAGEGNALSGSKTGSTYRYVNTARLQKAAEQARKGAEERQQRREARISASKEKQKEALKGTGSSEPIKVGAQKTSEKENKRSSAKPPKNKLTSKKTADVDGQQKLNLTPTKETGKSEVKAEETKKEVKETKPKNKITLNIGKHKQAEIKEPEKEEKQEPSKTPEKKSKPSVYLKGGNVSSKRKEENFDASREEQERYSLRKQIMDMRDEGKTGTPEYKALKAKYNALKSKVTNEALSESLVHLFTSNISEFTLKSIFEMVAASKKNADKVLKRNEDKLAVAVNNLSDNLAKTGKADPELIGKAEKALKHKEDFERRYDNKFNKEK